MTKLPAYPPRIPRRLVLRNLLRLARRPIRIFNDYVARYGENFILSVGGTRRTHFTVDAEVVQHVLQRNHRNYEKSEIQTTVMGQYLGYGLLTNSGSDWLRQRRLIQPGFHRRRLEALTVAMQRVVAAECASAAGGEAVDLFTFTRTTAYRIIVGAIFTDDLPQAETDAFQRILDRLQAYLVHPIRLPLLRGPLRWLGREAKFLALAGESREMLRGLIRQRRQSERKYEDLLQMLLDSRYEDDGEPMSEERLIDELTILFAAGYETSANALAWTVWLLLQHPEVEQRLVGELNTSRTAEGNPPPPYLTQIINESLRLYPPAWITDRVALGPDEAAGLTIDSGTTIGIYIYGIHRHERYYAFPDRFDPDRMTEEARKQRPAFSFLPFGGGPRLCIGHHFAYLEMQLFLAHLFTTYKVLPAAPLPDLEPQPFITLHQDKPVAIRLVLR